MAAPRDRVFVTFVFQAPCIRVKDSSIVSQASQLNWSATACTPSPGSLSIAIAAMRVFLDRGAQFDWFSSLEIIVEATVAVSAVYTRDRRQFGQPILENQGLQADMTKDIAAARALHRSGQARHRYSAKNI